MAPTDFIRCDGAESLARALALAVPRPAAVVGIGSAFRGDDGFGPAVVASIEASAGLWPIEAGTAPENVLGLLARSGCRGIIFVDAADLGGPPGQLAVVPAAALSDADVSTHAISLGLLAETIDRLARQTGGRGVVCCLLAAQPASLERSAGLSPAMAEAVRVTVEGLMRFATAPSADAPAAGGP